MSDIDLDRLTPAERMVGEDAMETEELKVMLARAEEYIKSFRWCPNITQRYFGASVGGILAVFLFKFDRPINEEDRWLWVVEGDLPSAYFVTDRARSGVLPRNILPTNGRLGKRCIEWAAT